MDEALLRQLIRQRLTDRRLPQSRTVVTIRETSGHGWPCDACDEHISPTQKTVLARAVRDSRTVVFHVDCYKLWDAELRTLAGSAAATDPLQSPASGQQVNRRR
jgi:hypothetical protein